MSGSPFEPAAILSSLPSPSLPTAITNFSVIVPVSVSLNPSQSSLHSPCHHHLAVVPSILISPSSSLSSPPSCLPRHPRLDLSHRRLPRPSPQTVISTLPAFVVMHITTENIYISESQLIVVSLN
uniref:Uncharacterized protein n=1 Tax=Micrurus surinamensis TaxID=129470 RepID=A0A2D4NZM8_MICSU